MPTEKTQFFISPQRLTLFPTRKKTSVLGVSDRTVTEQQFHWLDSTLKRYIFTDIPDDSYIHLQKDLNTLMSLGFSV